MNVSHAPALSLETARSILSELYGLDGAVSPLPSERDQNFRVLASDGRGYVLKVANPAETLPMLEAENAALMRGAAVGICPSLIPAVDGSLIAESAGHKIRLVTLLSGTALGFLQYQSPSLLADLGSTLGKLSAALTGFDHPAVHRDFHWDLANAERIIAEHLPKVADATTRKQVEVLLGVYRLHAAPLLAGLRKSVVHNDANDFNVIVDPDSERISGIIDFGDMVFTHTVNELAIAIAYVALGKDDPLGAMCQVARAYHREFSLLEPEIEALFSLACIRLCMSACLAAKQQAERPGDAYLAISQKPLEATLPKLTAIHPRLAYYAFREACGLAPVPHSPSVVEWLRQQDFASVIEGVDLRADAIAHLDLSVGSHLVSGDPRQNAPEPLFARLFAEVRAAGAVLGAGGYDEARALYAAPEFLERAPLDETRSIHLGVDLTAAAGTGICAVADGVVHGFEDANRFLDYGPVVVIRHDTLTEPYFTLYGHLSRQSLDGLRIGQPILKGESFAAIGNADENGGWWPHLHFQIITDMLDVACNFNGCALPRQREVWKSICPDPNLVLRIPALEATTAPSKIDLLRRRTARIGSNLSISYSRNPIEAVRGWMQYVYDADGRK
ncbi:MAG: phosphotransferase, partial [Bryobacteraceae bacterium]